MYGFFGWEIVFYIKWIRFSFGIYVYLESRVIVVRGIVKIDEECVFFIFILIVLFFGVKRNCIRLKGRIKEYNMLFKKC